MLTSTCSLSTGFPCSSSGVTPQTLEIQPACHLQWRSWKRNWYTTTLHTGSGCTNDDSAEHRPTRPLIGVWLDVFETTPPQQTLRRPTGSTLLAQGVTKQRMFPIYGDLLVSSFDLNTNRGSERALKGVQVLAPSHLRRGAQEPRDYRGSSSRKIKISPCL